LRRQAALSLAQICDKSKVDRLDILRKYAQNVLVTKHLESLLDYPRPSVAVDAAVLTVCDGTLQVLLIRRSQGHKSGEWSLPGTFVHPGETLARAVLRSLESKAGVRGRSPRQLRVFDDPTRDERGWVMSVAHLDVVPCAALEDAVSGSEVRLAPVGEAMDDGRDPALPYDHGSILRVAVDAVRAEYRNRPDPRGLLGEDFTLKELRELHEAVLGETLQRDTFRRAMSPALLGTGRISDGGKGRPAALFQNRFLDLPNDANDDGNDDE
jgi:ADP-ribose pyrophosphatase YjhB (NUDIX family)